MADTNRKEAELRNLFDDDELNTLGSLMRQMPVGFFSHEPARLEEQIVKLTHEGKGFGSPQEMKRTWKRLEGMGVDVAVLQVRAAQNRRDIGVALASKVGKLGDSEVEALLGLAESIARRLEESGLRLC